VTIPTAVAASSVASLRSAGLTIKPLSFTQLSGTLNVGGGPSVTLAGSYDSSTNNVNLSGGGFTFTGSISGAVLSGTYAGPSSIGEFSSLNSTQTSVTAYCGTYQSGGGSGAFNIDISATGAASGTTSQGCLLTGQLSGNSLALSCGGGGSGATGTVQNGTVSGTIGSGGTFSGSSGACTVPTPPPATGVVDVQIVLGGSGFTASLQNEALATSGTYDFNLQPGVYTISGQVQAAQNLTVAFHSPTNSSRQPGGVAMALQSSISCGGVANCIQPAPYTCSAGGVTLSPCYPPGGGGSQNVSACSVSYAMLHALTDCFIGVPPGTPPDQHTVPYCIYKSNSDIPLDYQLQFTVLAAPAASSPTCQ